MYHCLGYVVSLPGKLRSEKGERGSFEHNTAAFFLPFLGGVGGSCSHCSALQGDLNLACKSNVDHFSQLFSICEISKFLKAISKAGDLI